VESAPGDVELSSVRSILYIHLLILATDSARIKLDQLVHFIFFPEPWKEWREKNTEKVGTDTTINVVGTTVFVEVRNAEQQNVEIRIVGLIL
jgi:hypothetical protein